MIAGSCHCGRVHWQWRTAAPPESASTCNCTICRRYGVLWAYGYEAESITVAGETAPYVRHGGGEIAFHFCTRCGCLTHWRALRERAGRRRIAVNLRMAEPGAVAAIPIERIDGLTDMEPLPSNGRSVRDYWF